LLSHDPRVKGYPFEVLLPKEQESAVLADQVKGLDRVARKAMRKGKASAEALAEVRAKLRALVG
jgi:mRNA interferase MazF